MAEEVCRLGLPGVRSGVTFQEIVCIICLKTLGKAFLAGESRTSVLLQTGVLTP